jgi:hypothetical protein
MSSSSRGTGITAVLMSVLEAKGIRGASPILCERWLDVFVFKEFDQTPELWSVCFH